mgnify:CR=1 FL=1
MALTDKELLEKIRKLLAGVSDTSSRQPWQELLNRRSAVQPRSIRAVEAVSGFVGSWAASYNLLSTVIEPHTPDGYSQRPGTDAALVPVSVADSESRIGKPGLPEIDFVPYAHGTNQYGLKGPALIGHPVSQLLDSNNPLAVRVYGVEVGLVK